MDWSYEQPVKIEFGVNKRQKIPEIAQKEGWERGLLVCDPFFRTNGAAKELQTICGERLCGVFSEISPNPDVSEVDACWKAISEAKADFIVVLGGGSAMDCAKAASVITVQAGTVLEYFDGKQEIPAEHIPIVALPTTAGTGSEVTSVSVLTDRKRNRKKPLASTSFYPAYAVIDPVLTYSMPARVTASCGVDVLCHALEGYWSKNHQPICDALAFHALSLVFRYLATACEQPDNALAREKMCEAAVIAGMAFGLPKTTASHACSYPISSLYHIPHGEACGLTIDYFTRLNAQNDQQGRILDLAQKLGYESGEELADAIRALKGRIGMRSDLKQFDLTDADVEALAVQSDHPNLKNNPTEITHEMLVEMYRSMC